MLNRGLASINDAFDAGRFHSSRYYKINVPLASGGWTEVSAYVGQPSYDPRIGANSLKFFPTTYTGGNDFIYYPSVQTGSELFLVSAQMRAANNFSSGTIVLADCLGYYPLIDGDSNDLQIFDNTSTIPRYTDGVGVCASLLNNISPVVQAGTFTYSMFNSAGQTVSNTLRSSQSVVTGLVLNSGGAVATGNSSFALPTLGGQGVKRMESIQ